MIEREIIGYVCRLKSTYTPGGGSLLEVGLSFSKGGYEEHWTTHVPLAFASQYRIGQEVKGGIVLPDAEK